MGCLKCKDFSFELEIIVKRIIENISVTVISQGTEYHVATVMILGCQVGDYIPFWGSGEVQEEFLIFFLQYFINRKMIWRNNVEFQNEDDIFFKNPI